MVSKSDSSSSSFGGGWAAGELDRPESDIVIGDCRRRWDRWNGMSVELCRVGVGVGKVRWELERGWRRGHAPHASE